MQKRTIVCIILMLCAAMAAEAQDSYDERVRKYIEQYKDWAISEQQRSGVPASITLAQGIHETAAGSSELATNANNHFGIKCRKEWQGMKYSYTDDAPDECFRKYPSALQSYIDHSDYLKGGKRYDALFKLSIKDYKGWCVGLKRCGYATNPRYAHILINIIEKYDLHQHTVSALKKDYNPIREAENEKIVSDKRATDYNASPVKTTNPANELPVTPNALAKKSGLSVSYDTKSKNTEEKQTPSDTETDEVYPQAPEYGKLVKINGLKAFYAQKGAVLLEDAFKYNIRYARLLEINELPDLPLEDDMYIYLEKKHTKGIRRTHLVRSGETLIKIAQTEAMQLKYLKYYNRIGANEEPMPGAILHLQQYSEQKPPTYVRNAAPQGHNTGFAGSSTAVIPQGTTRTRSSYISKTEIKASQKTEDIFIDTAEEEESADMPSSTAIATLSVPAKTTIEEHTEAAVAEIHPSSTYPSAVKKPDIRSRHEAENERIARTIPAPALPASANDEFLITQETDNVLQQTDVNIVTAAQAEKTEVSLPGPEIITPVATISRENISSVPAKPLTIAVPEKKPVPQIPEEPKDEFDRLKAKLDRVVYAGASTETTVPTAKQTTEPAKAKNDGQPNVAPQANSAKLYTVKKGDTAFSIAKKHNITMRQLIDWNNLEFNKIKEGQKLRVKP